MPAERSREPRPRAVIVGGSLGALQALERLLPRLPAAYRLPVIVVLHQHRHSSSIGRALARHSPLAVAAIEDQAPIQAGHVYVCPANYHLLIDPEPCFSLSTEAPVNFARPSIDVSFESASRVYGAGLVGVLLSGATADGAAGLRCVRGAGGRALCQDPSSALEPTLPRAARDAVPAVKLGSPEALGLELSELSP